MRVVCPTVVAAALAFALSGCVVARTAAHVTGAVVSTTVDVTGAVVSGAARTVIGGGSHDSDGQRKKSDD